MASRSQRGVYVNSARLYVQPFQHLIQKNRRVWRAQICMPALPRLPREYNEPNCDREFYSNCRNC